MRNSRLQGDPGATGPLQVVDDKAAFITGGSSGIGLGIAEAFAEAGMSVAIGFRSAGHLDSAMSVLARFGDRICPVSVDVANRASVEAAAAEAERRFGKIHVLVANAGVGVIKPLSETTYEDWDWQLGINLTGVFNTIYVFLPLIRKHGEGGHIVATSSMMGLFTSPLHATYSASKFGVVGLMEGLRLDLIDSDIGVSVYCPGNVWANLETRTIGGVNDGGRSARGDADHARGERRDPDIAMDPLEAGQLVLRGIRANDLYILTHPEVDWMIRERHAAIEASQPSDLRPPIARIESVGVHYYNAVYGREHARKRPPCQDDRS